MNRRALLAGLAAAVAARPRPAGAQPSKKLPGIGYLATGPQGRNLNPFLNAFMQGLAELGYADGTDILLEYRQAEGRVDRFSALAQELVGLKVDLILATNSLAARAAKEASGTIPIVVPVMGDPIGDGLVASLARPGGNVTGLTFLGPELLPKRLALLKEALPAVSRIAALWHPGAYSERTMGEMLKGAQGAADGLAVTLRLVAARGPDELDRAFSDVVAGGADALVIFPSPMLFTELRRIAELAMRGRLPTMAMGREFAEFGGLMAYGASLADLHWRAAGYVDKILRGANPGDLPVEQPTKFDFVVNLKTATALGLTIPASILARADEVIE